MWTSDQSDVQNLINKQNMEQKELMKNYLRKTLKAKTNKVTVERNSNMYDIATPTFIDHSAYTSSVSQSMN